MRLAMTSKRAFTYDVVVAPTESPVSLNEVKNALKIPLSQTAEDELLQVYIESEFSVQMEGNLRSFANESALVPLPYGFGEVAFGGYSVVKGCV